MHPEPRVELHPRLAEPLGIAEGDWVTITTRRDAMTLRATVVRTIRPDTVFIPYHTTWQHELEEIAPDSPDTLVLATFGELAGHFG